MNAAKNGNCGKTLPKTELYSKKDWFDLINISVTYALRLIDLIY